MIATAQCRSRENSLNEAKATILNRLNNKNVSEENEKMSASRQQMMGSGERGDKVRTYRFQDNTVKDHRNGKQLSLDKVLSGNFNLLW